jgi:hypothetical protein
MTIIVKSRESLAKYNGIDVFSNLFQFLSEYWKQLYLNKNKKLHD